MSERAAVLTISWAMAAGSAGRLRLQFPDPLRQPRLEVGTARGRGGGQALDHHRKRVAPPVQVGPQVLAFVLAHLIEGAHGLLDRRFDEPREIPGGFRRVRRPLLEHEGLRDPNQVAGRQMSAHEAFLTRALDRVADVRRTNSPCSSTSGAGGSRSCTDTLSSIPPARDVALQQCPQRRFARRQALRQPHLNVQIAVVDGPDGDADRRPSIFTRERRETGH